MRRRWLTKYTQLAHNFTCRPQVSTDWTEICLSNLRRDGSLSPYITLPQLYWVLKLNGYSKVDDCEAAILGRDQNVGGLEVQMSDIVVVHELNSFKELRQKRPQMCIWVVQGSDGTARNFCGNDQPSCNTPDMDRTHGVVEHRGQVCKALKNINLVPPVLDKFQASVLFFTIIAHNYGNIWMLYIAFSSGCCTM